MEYHQGTRDKDMEQQFEHCSARSLDLDPIVLYFEAWHAEYVDCWAV